MKLALKIMSWVMVVIGSFAIAFSEGSSDAILGGLIFLTQGTLALAYVAQQEKKWRA